jgi:hypothetical protein
MDELVIGEKRYVSSKRAAEITGYAKDYVGQLCREGYVEAKMVGRSWYVLETSITEHRFGGTNITEHRSGGSRKANSEQETVPGTNEDTTTDLLPPTPESPIAGWKRPTYISEVPTVMPEIEVRTEAPAAVQGHSGAFSSDTHSAVESESNNDDALSDMQSAWKEWFEQKRTAEENEVDETPAPVTDENENYSNEEVESTKYEEKYSDVGVIETNEGITDGFDVPIHRQKETLADEVDNGIDEELQEEEVQIPLRKMPAHEQGIIHEERIIKSGKKSRIDHRMTAQQYRTPKPRSSLLSRTILIVVAGLVITVAVIGSGVATVGTNPVVDFLGGTSKINK